MQDDSALPRPIAGESSSPLITLAETIQFFDHTTRKAFVSVCLTNYVHMCNCIAILPNETTNCIAVICSFRSMIME